MSNKKVTVSDFIAKDRKGIPFEERAKKFEEALTPLVTEWGVQPSAALNVTQGGIIPVPVLQDAWQKDS